MLSEMKGTHKVEILATNDVNNACVPLRNFSSVPGQNNILVLVSGIHYSELTPTSDTPVARYAMRYIN